MPKRVEKIDIKDITGMSEPILKAISKAKRNIFCF